ncbi:hypothetical protein M413DRAFT_24280 [Hebeloma cylindrosporum]|uniref:DUF6533 domain-containing protein n=1 Tax=Hebeloma cylindrosporum TaxID=76867 RepID=A0A0C2Z041_HEBCY|nr:hypothetical protein M413DRAFT_24280 [Hebeloma cylindrosporum h7]
MVTNNLAGVVSHARTVSSVNGVYLPSIAESNVLTNGTTAASVAILVFDSFLTFDTEVSAIWSREWTFARALYVFTRYSGFVQAGTPFTPRYYLLENGNVFSCFNWIHVRKPSFCGNKRLRDRSLKGLIALGMGAGEMLMTLRTWAAWNKDRTLTYILPIFYTVIWVGSLVAVGIFVRSLQFDLVRSPYTGCYVTQMTPLTYGWALLLTFDTVMFILIAIPAWKACKLGSRLIRVDYFSEIIQIASKVEPASWTLYTETEFCITSIYLVRSCELSVAFFDATQVLSLINIIVTQTFPTGLGSVMVLFARVIHTLLACRVVLHIHECQHAMQYASQYSLAYRE